MDGKEVPNTSDRYDENIPRFGSPSFGNLDVVRANKSPGWITF